jgi:hypothetical protein
MPHRFLIALLAFGAIAGFASGFASLAHRHHWSPRAECSWTP